MTVAIAENPRAVMEEWKVIPSLPRYLVSSIGRVKGPSGNILRLQNRRGYDYFALSDGKGSSTKVSVARCVCEAFNGGSGDGQDCDHINRIRNDNVPQNLRWVSRHENLSNRNIVHGQDHHNAKLSEEAVRAIRALPHYRGFDEKLAKEFGTARETIRDVRLGKLWRHVDA